MTQEVLNTCNSGYADFRDIWRRSWSNGNWYEVGNNGVTLEWFSNYQTNPHWKPDVAGAGADEWDTYCFATPCN